MLRLIAALVVLFVVEIGPKWLSSLGRLPAFELGEGWFLLDT